jgi:hypothetical protein
LFLRLVHRLHMRRPLVEVNLFPRWHPEIL